MNNIYPCLKVCDIETSIEWYEHFLGFTCTFKSSIKNPEFATIENGDFKIYMASGGSNESYASNIIVIEIDDINTSLQLVEDAGAIMYQSIGPGFFGTTEFIIKDYEDNKIIYRQKA